MFHRKEKVKKERIVEIDFIRGVLIWFMVIDHFFYDFTSWGVMRSIFPTLQVGLIDTANFYWSWPVRVGTRLAILALFFLISGISCYFSRNNFKRGLILFGLGCIISLAFFIVGNYIVHDTGMFVFFGAISCFGLSILIFALVQFLLKKLASKYENDFKWIYLGLGTMVIGLGILFGVWNMNGGSAGPPYVSKITWDNFMLVILGVRQHSGSDWLPLCPYLGFMFVGAFLGEVIYKDRKSLFKKLPTKEECQEPTIRKVNYYGVILPYKGIKNLFSFSGHYSLFFYIFHQPVLILGSMVVLLCMGYRF